MKRAKDQKVKDLLHFFLLKHNLFLKKIVREKYLDTYEMISGIKIHENEYIFRNNM